MPTTLKTLYIGELWHGGTCLERAKVLAENGWEVIHFDITPYLRVGGRVLAGLQHRLLWGPAVARFNRDLLDRAREIGRLDILWVDKGRWLRAETLAEIKRQAGVLAVHYTPDPAFTVHTSRHFAACLPLYDLCVTTKRYELDAYAHNGARETLFTLQGVDDRFVRLPACGRIEGRPVDVMFIGHREPHYERVLSVARQTAAGLRVHGARWPQLGRQPAWHGIVAPPVLGDEYAETLAQARIGLGLLSKMCPDAFTTRSFEIPAAGAMLLAERTPEHEALYEEGREAAFFGSDEELRDKVEFYLRHEDLRQKVAQAGRTRTLAQYHWRHVLAPAIQRVERIRHGG